MREITIQQRKINIRSLTGAQINGLKPLGFGRAVFTPAIDTINEAWDKAFACVLSPEDLAWLDTLEERADRKVWEAILAETYGNRSEEKNLPGISGGTQTQNASNTVTSAVPEKKN